MTILTDSPPFAAKSNITTISSTSAGLVLIGTASSGLILLQANLNASQIDWKHLRTWNAPKTFTNEDEMQLKEQQSAVLHCSIAGTSSSLRIAASFLDGSIFLFSTTEAQGSIIESKELAWPAGEKKRLINDLQFNEDGTLLAAAGEDKKVRLWKVEEDNITSNFQILSFPDGRVQTISFHPRLPHLLVGLESLIKIVNIEDGEEILQICLPNHSTNSSTYLTGLDWHSNWIGATVGKQWLLFDIDATPFHLPLYYGELTGKNGKFIWNPSSQNQFSVASLTAEGEGVNSNTSSIQSFTNMHTKVPSLSKINNRLAGICYVKFSSSQAILVAASGRKLTDIHL